jgi:hypothetical protein
MPSVDAICISQGNIHERNHQVNQMTLIHEQATRVIAWLGASEASSMELISSFQGGTQFIQPPTDPKVLNEGNRNSLLFMPFLFESIGADFRSSKNSYLRKSSYSNVVVINVLRSHFLCLSTIVGYFDSIWRKFNGLGGPGTIKGCASCSQFSAGKVNASTRNWKYDRRKRVFETRQNQLKIYHLASFVYALLGL